MILSFHPCIEADIQIILGDKRPGRREIKFIKEADAIILPQSCSKELFETCISNNPKAYLFPEYKVRFEYPGKTGQIRLFKKLSLPHPDSICLDNPDQLNIESLPYDFPFLIKEDLSHEGTGVYLIRSRDELKEVIKNLEGRFIIQEFVETGGNVLRVAVIGKRLISYWKRPIYPDQVITTLSRNAKIDYFWKPELQEKGRSLVRELISKTGLNLCAVDLIFRKEEPLLLEINYYFGRRGLGGSERFYLLLFQAVKEYLEEKKIKSDSVKLTEDLTF